MFCSVSQTAFSKITFKISFAVFTGSKQKKEVIQACQNCPIDFKLCKIITEAVR